MKSARCVSLKHNLDGQLSELQDLKETQIFKAYSTESYKHLHHYYRKQHKNSKIHSLLNKLLSLIAFLSVYCDSCFLRLPQR